MSLAFAFQVMLHVAVLYLQYSAVLRVSYGSDVLRIVGGSAMTGMGLAIFQDNFDNLRSEDFLSLLVKTLLLVVFAVIPDPEMDHVCWQLKAWQWC